MQKRSILRMMDGRWPGPARFGKLTVIGPMAEGVWDCRCSCGATVLASTAALESGAGCCPGCSGAGRRGAPPRPSEEAVRIRPISTGDDRDGEIRSGVDRLSAEISAKIDDLCVRYYAKLKELRELEDEVCREMDSLIENGAVVWVMISLFVIPDALQHKRSVAKCNDDGFSIQEALNFVKQKYREEHTIKLASVYLTKDVLEVKNLENIILLPIHKIYF